MAFDTTPDPGLRPYGVDGRWRFMDACTTDVLQTFLVKRLHECLGYDISEAETASSRAKISTQGCREVRSANIGLFTIVYYTRKGAARPYKSSDERMDLIAWQRQIG